MAKGGEGGEHNSICYDYPASEFSAALAKFKELENYYKEEN